MRTREVGTFESEISCEGPSHVSEEAVSSRSEIQSSLLYCFPLANVTPDPETTDKGSIYKISISNKNFVHIRSRYECILYILYVGYNELP